MGYIVVAQLVIKHKEMYDKIISCMFENPYIKEKLNNEEFDKYDGDDKYYIDLAKFFGLRDTLYTCENDKELNEEEIQKMGELAGWKRPTRCAACRLSEWKEQVGECILTLSGTCGYPDGVVTYITKIYPNEVFELTDYSLGMEEDYQAFYEIKNGSWECIDRF